MKPEPKPQHVICSVCGLPWEPHGDDPTLETCVRLLVAELAKQPTIRTINPFEVATIRSGYASAVPANTVPSTTVGFPPPASGGTYTADPIPQPSRIWCATE